MSVTREQVQRLRKQFTERGYEMFPVEVNGIRFICFILPEALCPALPNFAFQCVAAERSDPHGDAVFGVSAGIKPEWRSFVAAHEIREYWIGMTCAEAARAESSAVMHSDLPEQDQQAYFEMRRAFFTLLVPYATQEHYAAEKLSEFEATRAYLFELDTVS